MTSDISATDGSGIEIGEVMNILPHRYPFLLVDRVVACVPGQYIQGIKNIARSEPILASEQREMPPLLVIEALAQLSVILAFKTLRLHPTGNELMFFAGIENAKFEYIACPGDQLSLRSNIGRIRKMAGWFHARAEVDGRLAVDVSMLAAIKTPA